MGSPRRWLVGASLFVVLVIVVGPQGVLVEAAPVAGVGTPAGAVVRVNAGGAAYTGANGSTWQADAGFSGGTTAAFAATVSGTSDPTLYQTERHGKTFSYSFNVPNGPSSVTLKFAEMYWSSPGQRVFSVAINGQQVLSNFDILANVAKNAALDKTFFTDVPNSVLNIAFTTVADNAKIDAIEILPAP